MKKIITSKRQRGTPDFLRLFDAVTRSEAPKYALDQKWASLVMPET